MIPSVLPTYSRAPLQFVKGEGSWLIEADGRRFVDLGAGIAVNALGHQHPELTKALHEQVDKLWHTSNVYFTEPTVQLAKELVDLHGQVVADNLAGRQISAPGGYNDFQRGARLSNGGRSMVLMAAAVWTPKCSNPQTATTTSPASHR